jgi:acyl-CoA hydrolase
VTEWGVAELFGKSTRERAASLIEIAHPEFREALAAEARRTDAR